MRMSPTVLRMFASLVFFLSGSRPSAAESVADDTRLEADSEIVVVGLGDQFRLTGKQLRAAVTEFRKGRSSYAPDSKLLFRVRVGERDGLELALWLGGQLVPLVLDADGSFTLPELGEGDLRLVANRGRTRITVTPVILSVGTDDSHRRLGDLRLQCRVEWALVRTEVSLFFAGIYEAAGGCASKRFDYFASAGRAVASGRIHDGLVQRLLQTSPGGSFRPPISDRVLPNDSQIELTFR